MSRQMCYQQNICIISEQSLHFNHIWWQSWTSKPDALEKQFNFSPQKEIPEGMSQPENHNGLRLGCLLIMLQWARGKGCSGCLIFQGRRSSGCCWPGAAGRGLWGTKPVPGSWECAEERRKALPNSSHKAPGLWLRLALISSMHLFLVCVSVEWG